MLNRLLDKYGNQSQIAYALGVSPMAVSKWFTGKSRPGRYMCQKIADDLGVSLGEVFESSNQDLRKKGGINGNHTKPER